MFEPLAMPTAAPPLPRLAGHCATWHEVFLDHAQAGAAASVTDSLRAGHSVLVLHAVSSTAECKALAAQCALAAALVREERGPHPLVRKRADELIGKAGATICEDLLIRQLALLHSPAPGLVSALFGDVLGASLLQSITHNPELAWSEGEPAINVYTPGGRFTPHEDEQSLTLLLNLSEQDAYTGGGTAFWSLADGGGPGKGRDLPESTPPSQLLAPAVGTAIVFGGQVTHAAQPVLTGERIVFVASFSPLVGRQRSRALQAGFAGLRGGRRRASRPADKYAPTMAPSLPPDASAPTPSAAAMATIEDTSLEALCAALTSLATVAGKACPQPTAAVMPFAFHEEEVD